MSSFDSLLEARSSKKRPRSEAESNEPPAKKHKATHNADDQSFPTISFLHIYVDTEDAKEILSQITSTPFIKQSEISLLLSQIHQKKDEQLASLSMFQSLGLPNSELQPISICISELEVLSTTLTELSQFTESDSPKTNPTTTSTANIQPEPIPNGYNSDLSDVHSEDMEMKYSSVPPFQTVPPLPTSISSSSSSEDTSNDHTDDHTDDQSIDVTMTSHHLQQLRLDNKLHCFVCRQKTLLQTAEFWIEYKLCSKCPSIDIDHLITKPFICPLCVHHGHRLLDNDLNQHDQHDDVNTVNTVIPEHEHKEQSPISPPEISTNLCIANCGRPRSPGTTSNGNPFKTCCRRCAVNFQSKSNENGESSSTEHDEHCNERISEISTAKIAKSPKQPITPSTHTPSTPMTIINKLSINQSLYLRFKRTDSDDVESDISVPVLRDHSRNHNFSLFRLQCDLTAVPMPST